VKTHCVTFQPDDSTVRVESGQSILDAAKAAGIALNSVCNGDGVCGKCRVLIKSGPVRAAPTMFLDRDDIQHGAALACLTFPSGDVVVEVPVESRRADAPHFTHEDAVRFGDVRPLVGEGTTYPPLPLVRKIHLELPEPTIGDSLPDQERLYKAVREHEDAPIMQTGLAVLRRLPGVLRSCGWDVTLLLGSRGGTVEVVDVEPGNTAHANYGVAVDLGTTTVVAHLVDLTTGETLGTSARYNSQSSFGEDVIARIMYAEKENGLRTLQETVVKDINSLISAVVVDADVRLSDVTCIALAGNTTMTQLLFGLDPGAIRRQPYVPCAMNPPVVRAAEVGITINGRGLLTVFPCVASYVGGDVVSDVLVAEMTRTEDLSLLIDLGTNGEIVLGNSEWLMCCSASAGPSFEGGGISCGMRATSGAIEWITLGEGGAVTDCGIVAGGKPLGLCGSGLIDTVAGLLTVGCIDRGGRFVEERCGDRLRETDGGERAFLLFPGEETGSGRDIVLTAADITNLIHSKGSVYMAADCLLTHVGLTFQDVTKVYIAGGFGNHLRVEQAIRIGLLPDVDRSVFEVLGNGSVQGAKIALLSEHGLQYAREHIAPAMTSVELSTSHQYMNEYTSCLFLPHTDMEKFPSVAALADRREN